MAIEANKYGMVTEDGYVEQLMNEEYVKLESNAVTGQYRLVYKYYSKTGYVDAYVYMDVTVNVIELECTTETNISLDEINTLFAEVITLDNDRKLTVYDEEIMEYVPITDNFEFITGTYRYFYTFKDEQDTVLYTGFAYLKLTVNVTETPEQQPETETDYNQSESQNVGALME